MNSKLQKALSSFLIFIIGSVYIFSGITKYNSVDIYEISLVEQGLANWNYTRFLARAIIGFEIGLGVLLLLHYQVKKTLKINILLLSFFSIILGIQIITGTELENCFCFGEKFELSNSESIFKNAILILFSILALKLDSLFEIKKWKYAIVFSSIIILSITSVCILYPPLNIYGEFNVDTFKSGDEFPKIDSLPESVYKEPTILALLSPTCTHCYQAALKLSIMEKKGSKYNIVPVFGLGMDKIDVFLTESELQSKWYNIDKKNFLQLTKGRFPQIYVLEEGKVKEILNKRKFIEKNLD